MSPKAKLAALRQLMKKHGVAAYLVPSSDDHLNEYVPDCWQRRRWLSGFTGSAGDLVITDKEAGLWTDSRYFLQATQELKGSGIRLRKLAEPGVPSINEYLTATLNEGESLGVDPRVITIDRAKGMEKALKSAGARLNCIDENLIDAIWQDRPAPSNEQIMLHPKKYAGETIASKLRRLRKEMKKDKADAHIVTNLDGIAWLYNIRGRDVDFNPVAISYAIVTQKDAHLYIDLKKVSMSTAKKLGPQVTFRPYKEVAVALRGLASKNSNVLIDETLASRWVADLLDGANLTVKRTPIAMMKSKKNDTEIAGMRAAHIRDGAAMVKFFRWLEESVPGGEVTEISAAERLEAFRMEDKLYQGPSFDTISGYAGHGAIIHYRVTKKSNSKMKPEGLYLIDTGGQYLDGTTDTTRTVPLGKRVSKKIKDQFTRVLKGNIALANAKFPEGTKGIQIDYLARRSLWEVGLNYKHGTGHGVGAFLNVHEGPQSIGPYRDTEAPFEPGNTLSNEPGYYEPGSYGIRTETLILVKKESRLSKKGTPFLQFETLTMCPIDTRPIDVKMLDAAERKWLNDYHKKVYRTLSKLLGPEDRAWLKKACAAI